mmetsp:Transcript_2105/g.8369  ORF Transcript_2105/g.8369 Transcript_2105/m.8369 type:complete len:284 (+) Transcript_2105:37-888(+)
MAPARASGVQGHGLHPPVRVLALAHLQLGEVVVQQLRDLAHLAALVLGLLALVRDAAHRRKHHRGARAEHLVGVEQGVHLQVALDDLEPVVPGELDDRATRDARQDGALERRRGDGLALHREDVAAAHLLHVLVVHRVEVHEVAVAALLGEHLRLQHRRVVSHALDSPRAARPRAVHVVRDGQVDGRELAALEVRSDGRAVHEQGVLGRGREPQDGTRADEQRPQVERANARRRHPALVGRDGALDGVDEHLGGRRGHAHARGTVLHAAGVGVRAEDDHLAVL